MDSTRVLVGDNGDNGKYGGRTIYSIHSFKGYDTRKISTHKTRLPSLISISSVCDL